MLLDRLNIRNICRSVICFLIGRAYIFGVNPAVVAVIIIIRSGKNKDRLLICASLLGILSGLIPGTGYGGESVKYILTVLCIICIDSMAYARKMVLSKNALMLTGAAVTFLISLGGGIVNIIPALIGAAAEAVLVVIYVNLMVRGMEWFEYGRPGYSVNPETMISVIICMTLAIAGIPDVGKDIIPLQGIAYYMYLLYMSYRYGIAAGAMTGAAVGIAEGIATGNAAISGMYCLAGICAGVVRELGRVASVMAFLISGCIIAMLYPEALWNIRELKSAAAASVFIIMLPLGAHAGDDEERIKTDIIDEYDYRYDTARKLSEFAKAIAGVGEEFSKQAAMVPVINTASAREIFSELTNSVCGACTNNNYCWGQLYYDTYHETLNMLECAENVGHIGTGDVSGEFSARCIHIDRFMNETNRQLELSRIGADIRNRQTQTRILIAEQMKEVARLIEQLQRDVLSSDRVYIEYEDVLRDRLRSIGVRLGRIEVYDKSNGARYVYMRVKTDGGYVAASKIGEVLSEAAGYPYKVAEDMPSVIAKDAELLTYIKDVRYRVLTGTARAVKDGETLSGDNYSFVRLASGKFVMTITDGMGSGKNAFRESEAVIEMLEQLLGAGFGEEMALRFINSTMVFTGKEDIFSTVDMCVVDLNSGMCECIKCGAASTYIKKKSGVRIAKNDSVPIGIIPEMNYESTSYRLNDGDYVIMVSDGIEDSFPDDDKEAALSSLIEAASQVNAGEMAEFILESAKCSNMYKASDDMSVIVAQVLDKY